eukprot:4698407-Amphidinium_carterae.1
MLSDEKSEKEVVRFVGRPFQRWGLRGEMLQPLGDGPKRYGEARPRDGGCASHSRCDDTTKRRGDPSHSGHEIKEAEGKSTMTGWE